MGQDQAYHGKLSVLVNTCDAYEDLWNPFFTLLKRYLPIDVPIYLNTETKHFQMAGLDVRCVHPPERYQKCPYGKRMQLALKHINTEYVLLLLDDFFLRKPVDMQYFDRIINWMDADKNIVYFNSEVTQVYADWEVDKYRGFRRMPPGNDYILNMQAAVWRRKSLLKYWRSDVSPWEWEIFCNARTTKYPRDKFYCAARKGASFMDYGHYRTGDLWGVVQGKWYFPDIKPFFEKEGIDINFDLRGEFIREKAAPVVAVANNRYASYRRVLRCLGAWDVIRCVLWGCKRRLLKRRESSYVELVKEKTRRKFLSRKQNEEGRINK